MSFARLLARKSLFGRPGRTLFSVLGVAIGIATVVAIFTLDHVTILSRTRGLPREEREQEEAGGELEVRPSRGVEDPREELLRLEGVAGVAAFFQNDVRVRSTRAAALGDGTDDASGAPVGARLVALDAAGAAELGAYHVETGRALEPGAREDEALLGAALAETLGVAVGDTLYLAPPRRAAPRRCIDGQLVSGDRPASDAPAPEQVFRVVGILAREGLGRRASGAVVVVDFEPGRRLFADVFVDARYWVKRDAAVDLETLESRLGKRFSLARNEAAVIGQMADERAFRNGVRVAGLFALLLGLFVIFHTLSMSLVERIREVGTLNALGATRAQIARAFFTEAFLIAVAAGALGVLGGIALAKALLREGITTLGVTDHPVRVFEVPWSTALGLAALGVGIALAGSIAPLLRARGADVVSVLRGEDQGRARRSPWLMPLLTLVLLVGAAPALFFTFLPLIGAPDPRLLRTLFLGLASLALLIGVPLALPRQVGELAALLALPFQRANALVGRLAARNLTESPTRVGASVAALALVTAAFVALSGMTRSLRAETEEWGARAVADKVYVEGLRSAKLDELVPLLHELPEVVGVESGDARTHLDFLLLGLRTGELAGYGPALDDPELLRRLDEEQGVVVSERLARQRGLRLGDALFVNTSGHGVQSFRVVGIGDEYGYFLHPDERSYAVTSDRHLRRYFCVDVATSDSVAVRLGPGADPGVVGALLRDRLGDPEGLRVTTGREVLALHLADIDRDFVLFDIILGLTAVLAGLGILNGQLLAALERQKELGILRALGMSGAQLAGAVLVESGIVGLAGGLLGAAVGNALVPAIVGALRAVSGFDLPLRGPGPALALDVAGALALSLAAGLYPLWRMTRADAVAAVRTG